MVQKCPQCGDEVERRTTENEAGVTLTGERCVSCDYGYLK